MEEGGLDRRNQICIVRSGLRESRNIEFRSSVKLSSVDDGVNRVRAIGRRLRRVDLKFRPKQPKLCPVLRREVAEHAGRVKQILPQPARRVEHSARIRNRSVQTAQQVYEK